MRHVITVATLALFLVESAMGQGALTPPGAPAPTMKTLDQVEPRIPITNIPANITASGSYYLTGNFAGAAGTNGVTINASDVSLDLCGFALTGVPGSGDGIKVNAGRKSIVIRNGIVNNWAADGVDAGGSSALHVQVMDIVAVTNSEDGIRLQSISTAMRCVANDNGGDGIVGIGVACLVKDCVAANNKGDGINMPTSSHVSDCTARDNFNDGFALGGGCVLRGCSSVANDKAGIRVSGPGTVIENCSAAASGTEGIIISTKDTYVLNNVVDQNGGAGVSAGILVTNTGVSSTGNRLDSNLVTENDIGIQVLGVSNLLVRNSVRGSLSGTNYSIVAGNSVGAITNVGGIVIGTANPWANFEF